jgi:hypothetical protein
MGAPIFNRFTVAFESTRLASMGRMTPRVRLDEGLPTISATLLLSHSSGGPAVRKLSIVLLTVACFAGSAIAESVTYILETPGVV